MLNTINMFNIDDLTSVVARVIPLGWNCSAAAATLDRPSSVWHAFKGEKRERRERKEGKGDDREGLSTRTGGVT